jgi:hypothetical protein
MENDKINQLIEILSIPSYFGMEQLVLNYLIQHGTDKGYTVHQDKKGNVYFEKGKLDKGEFFPCVCAHTDSVFEEHIELVKNNERKDIRFGKKETNKMKLFAYMPNTNKRTGISGDDLAGVFICLQMMEKFDKIKAAFFVEEEFGCLGSSNCDLSFFKNVGYVIQFDGPTGNWFTKTLSGINVYSEESLKIVKPILEKYKISNYSDDPYTDILPLKEKFDFSCFNLPTGYFNWHSNQEYVDTRYVQKGIDVGIDFITTLGNKLQKYELNSHNMYSDYDYAYDSVEDDDICENCGDIMLPDTGFDDSDILVCISCGSIKQK